MAARIHEVTRLEGFSDAVFGFALTLLVVSLEVPEDVEGLKGLLRQAVPFGLTFAMVCYIWWEHNKFFRRYGLQDAVTAFVNAVLLFVVLFYVYPLKFLARVVVGPMFGAPLPRGLDSPTGMSGGAFALLIYSIGITLIFACFFVLYRYAWRRRDELHLTPDDVVTLRFSTRAQLISTTLGVLSILLVLTIPDRLAWLGGVLYVLMGPLHAWNGYQAGAAHAVVAKAASDA